MSIIESVGVNHLIGLCQSLQLYIKTFLCMSTALNAIYIALFTSQRRLDGGGLAPPTPPPPSSHLQYLKLSSNTPVQRDHNMWSIISFWRSFTWIISNNPKSYMYNTPRPFLAPLICLAPPLGRCWGHLCSSRSHIPLVNNLFACDAHLYIAWNPVVHTCVCWLQVLGKSTTPDEENNCSVLR